MLELDLIFDQNYKYQG